MSQGTPTSDLVRSAATGLARISAFIADELGGKPTLGELLEVIGWGVPTESELLESAPASPVRITPSLTGARRPEDQPSRVADLNDASFVEASDVLADLAQAQAAALGRPTTLTELTALLLDGLHHAGPIVSDVEPTEVLALAALDAKPVKRPKVGDVLAIPARGGGFHLASVLARNSFGTALGLYRGVHPVPRLSRPVARPFPVHTSDHLVASGEWQVVGNDPTLLSLFPAEPEIYHRNAPFLAIPGLPRIGPFGSAETAAGRMRDISEDEARRVGLLDDTYEQVHLAEILQEKLNSGTLFPTTGEDPP